MKNCEEKNLKNQYEGANVFIQLKLFRLYQCAKKNTRKVAMLAKIAHIILMHCPEIHIIRAQG